MLRFLQRAFGLIGLEEETEYIPPRVTKTEKPRPKPKPSISGFDGSCIKESYICELCPTLTTNWCSGCELIICDNCLRFHNIIPAARHHNVGPLSDNAKQILKKKGKKKTFVCDTHDNEITHFCKDCYKPLCGDCRSKNHMTCRDVITDPDMVFENKQQLYQRKERIDDAEKKIREKKMDMFLSKSPNLKLEVEESFQSAVDFLREKEARLIEKLTRVSDRQNDEFRREIRSMENDEERYKQQSELIKEILKFEDDIPLSKMYMLPGANVTEIRSVYTFDVYDIRFIKDLEKLRKEIDKMDVILSDGFNDVTTTAKFIIHAKIDESDICYPRDGVVVKINDTKVAVVTDNKEKRVMSFYTKCGKTYYLDVDNFPCSIAVLNDDLLAVSIPCSNKILKVSVDPDLKLLSTVSTDKQYFGLDVLDQSTLVASSLSPPRVDVLDMEGRIMRSIQTLLARHNSFKYPLHLHVTRQGTILVSDWGLKSVICLSQSGNVVFTYSPTGDRALVEPRGITSTSTGDILVADFSAHKVIHLSQSGEFIEDILTSQDGIEHPVGLCIEEDKLYVTEANKGFTVFQFSQRLQ